MRTFKKLIFLGLVVGLISGCSSSSSSGDTSVETLDFNDAKLVNFSELDNYNIITGKDGQNISLKATSSTKKDNEEHYQKSSKIAKKTKEIFINAILNPGEKKFSPSLNSSSNSQNTYHKNDTENGNISGTLKYDLVYNYDTGSINGTMVYSNYKDYDSAGGCSSEEAVKNNGTLYATGTFDTDNYDVLTLTITTKSDFIVDSDILKKGLVQNIVYNNSSTFSDDETITLTSQVVSGNESVGFKDYKYRSYSDNGYSYEYMISGNVYIFSDDLNGYFSVDSSYDHNTTPMKIDYCYENVYSGTEKYVGDNSTLTYSITTTNQYLIEIDSNNDGVIDNNLSGNVWE